MKMTPLLLAGSLALNALVAVALVRSGSGAPTPAAMAKVANSQTPAKTEPPATAAALQALEPAALQAELQRLKFPPEAIDALVIARIYARHDARRHELMIETAQRPWWQTAAAGPERLSLMTAEQRKELRHLAAAARSEAVRLLGPEALDRDGAMAAAHPFVPADRAVLLDGLVNDYRDMYAMLREDLRGLRTAKDREQEAWIEGQRQRDLEKLLDPAEREIFALRSSQWAPTFAYRSFTFEPSEVEYRTISAVYREFYDTHPGSLTVEGSTRAANFNEYPEYEEKIRGILGDARYDDWALAGQRYTATFTQIAPEYGFTQAQVREAATLLRDTAARSWQIGDDPGSDLEQKRAAASALVAATKATLVRQLGETASTTVLRDATWLDSIAQGNAVKVNGYSVESRGFSHSPPTSRPPGTPAPRN